MIICHNAGDVLSDGTHFVDTVRHLAGDAEAQWVLAQVYRRPPDPSQPRAMGFQASGGWRYGHVIETGALALIQFANGIRAEVHSGELITKSKWYQHYEVIGSEGRLRRANDNADPPLVIQDSAGGWRPVTLDRSPIQEQVGLMGEIFRRFAQVVRCGDARLPEDPPPAPAPDGQAPPPMAHPLSGDSALKDHELVMAIYESARLRRRLEPPLQQDRFPLEIMIDQGQL
jgi:predicted dehydrogenase